MADDAPWPLSDSQKLCSLQEPVLLTVAVVASSQSQHQGEGGGCAWWELLTQRRRPPTVGWQVPACAASHNAGMWRATEVTKAPKAADRAVCAPEGRSAEPADAEGDGGVVPGRRPGTSAKRGGVGVVGRSASEV